MTCLHMQVVLNSFYVTLWISLSGTVILYNKWILAYYGFPYPISLTMWHMAFSSVLAVLCVRLGYVPAVNMTTETYMKAIVPIGALFAGEIPGTTHAAMSRLICVRGLMSCRPIQIGQGLHCARTIRPLAWEGTEHY